MMAEAYPLYWPIGWKRTQYRHKSKFSVSGFGRARDLLLKEVRLLGGKSIVLSTNIALRLDGLPYANEREPEDPGVAVYFQYKNQPMCFACDRWRTVRENAYAVAKSIEAMRGIERWGSSQMMERTFTGFAALPEKSGSDWWDVLQVRRDAEMDAIEASFRRLALERHPDRGGSHEAMAQLNRAREEALYQLHQVA